MRVLVTGGAGYIGSHTCKLLAANGHEPIVYDNLVHGHEHAVKWGPFEKGDILDQERLDEVMARHKPEAVIHLAAYAYVGESVIKPDKYYKNNIQGSMTLLDAMRRNDIDKIVFSSSCATYGLPASLPIIEELPQHPTNPYGLTKFVIEHALYDYGVAYGLKWIALRYFNAAGCDPEGELGEEHTPETHALPLAIKAALGDGNTFSIFGTDYDTPDGTAVRDYVHVNDLADAHIRSLNYLDAGKPSRAFNLATGEGISVRQLVDAVGEAVGKPVPFETSDRRAGDPTSLYASGDAARKELGWEPSYSSFDKIVETAVGWFKRQQNTKSESS